ncbi:hypothetical protein [Dokdonella immobilis]|uniref:Uncharacterized protein n=1 Tax=Dokdonella immobilis TaxID=578942 RepID=A0A1I5AAW8_9GAMM|nr:hypothetical protein [Dokdonella immobilis]SFN59299.1 hypothetical protein SAMN05216289_13420 [Dokdonella immobilis]
MSKAFAVVVCLLLGSSVMATEIPLKNADFELPMAGLRIPGWSRTQHAGVRAYVVERDAERFAHGKHSIRMRRTTEQAYGMISQVIEAADLAGKPVELAAKLKTAEVGKKGWVMKMTFLRYSAIIDQVRATPVTGDTEWTEVAIRKDVPAGTTAIEIGFLLLDGGTGWADDVHLRTRAVENDKTDASAPGTSAAADNRAGKSR